MANFRVPAIIIIWLDGELNDISYSVFLTVQDFFDCKAGKLCIQTIIDDVGIFAALSMLTFIPALLTPGN